MASIDPIKPQSTTSIVTPNKTATVKDNKNGPEAKTVQQPEVTPEQLQRQIHRWFAQAGIRPAKYTDMEEDIDKRVKRRQEIKQQQKLQNLEKILGLALDYCPSQEVKEGMDPDWFFSFVDMAENIYSPAMQELWGKIFAVEIGSPGSFSLRTLETLRQLTLKDAQCFKQAVSLACRRKNEPYPKILFGYARKASLLSFFSLPQQNQLNLGEFGLSYPDLLSLMDMGLIYNSEIESGELSDDVLMDWRGTGKHFCLRAKGTGYFLKYYKFTSTGAELYRLVNAPVQHQYHEALQELLAPGFIFS